MKTWLAILSVVFVSSLARAYPVENDFVDEPKELAPFALSPDPEAVPKPGETQADVDHRLGPWLQLNSGGVAVGSPQGINGIYGSLVGGTPLPDQGAGFKRIVPQDEAYGTGFMISLVENASAEIAKEYPGLTVYFGDIARPQGGLFNPPHKSHQNGLDADIAFMGQTTFQAVLDSGNQVTSRFDFEKNWRMWRLLSSQRFAQNGKVESIVAMILVAPEIKQALCVWANSKHMLDNPDDRFVMRALRPTEGHEDHFHLRLRCSPYQKDCVKTYPPPEQTGCETPAVQ